LQVGERLRQPCLVSHYCVLVVVDSPVSVGGGGGAKPGAYAI
jgi:hypothetical protein